MEQFGSLVGTLLQSRNQAHVYHWQVQGSGAYAAHKALNDYYDEIVDLVDGLVESFQGRYGIFRGYVMSNSLKEDNNFVAYFEALAKFVERTRSQVPQDSYLQNQIDTIVELIESTKYKLKNLQ
jgi:DNA-binding ferritin-like protein